MFKLSRLFFLFLFYSFSSTAQKRTEFGIKLGPNFTRAALLSYTPTYAEFNNYTSSDFGIGYSLRVFATIPLSERFSLLPEIGFDSYQQKQLYGNSRQLNSTGSLSKSDKLSESELLIDLLLKYKTKNFSINLGPQIGFINKAIITTTHRSNGSTSNYMTEKIDFKQGKNSNSTEVAFLIGLSNDRLYKNWGAGLYYHIGLSEFTKYYQIRQIGKINGFLLQFIYSFGQ